MRSSIATVTITGLSPLSQSRMHDTPKLEGESHDDYDARTWPNKMHVAEIDGRRSVVIPAAAMYLCLVDGAKYSGEQIPGKGKATWTAKFASGIMIPADLSLNIDPDTIRATLINANADGVRGSGKRVVRRFPTIREWSATFEVYILDHTITRDLFERMLNIAGLFIGLGQGRPAMKSPAGNGRFKIASLAWQDNRQIAA